MNATWMAKNVSPELLKVAERAERDPSKRFLSLAHLIDEKALVRAFERLRKDAAVGVDGITKEQYGQQLSDNVRGLHERLGSPASRISSYRGQCARFWRRPTSQSLPTAPMASDQARARMTRFEPCTNRR